MGAESKALDHRDSTQILRPNGICLLGLDILLLPPSFPSLINFKYTFF